MQTRSLRLRLSSSGLRAFGLLAAAWTAASCNGIDTTRQAPQKATLGDDIFGVFCDRVGASVLTEDTSGASYHAICHYDEKGQYGDKVNEDETILPPPRCQSDQPKTPRCLAIAK